MKTYIITESQLNKLLLKEGYLDDLYLSDNFKRWFQGSKIVDENGRPILLGHATRSFGFNRFDTPFIHLSSIDDASYFSGGHKRMFKFKSTLNKLSDDEIIKLYNKHFAYREENALHLLDENRFKQTIEYYENKIQEWENETDEELDEYGITREENNDSIRALKKGIVALQKRFEKYNGKLYMKYFNGSFPAVPNDNNGIVLWLKSYYPTVSLIRQVILNMMFKKDEYMGNGGTYALCARVIKPLYIECKYHSWDNIYIGRDNCNGAYDELFDMYEQLGWNERHLGKGSDFALDNESIAIIAQKLGYDGVVFEHIKEGAYGTVRMDKTYIVFSTKQLKSPFENNGQFGDVENIWK